MFRRELHVVALAAECGVYARSARGEVAHSVAELSRALSQVDTTDLRATVRVIIPRYPPLGPLSSDCADYGAFKVGKPVAVTGPAWGVAQCPVSALAPTDRLSIHAIDCTPLLDAMAVGPAPTIYEPLPDPDASATEDEREAARRTALTFGLFCAAAVRLLQHWHEEDGWPVHVLHLHDWPVGVVAAMLEPGHAPSGWWPMWDEVGVWWSHYDARGPGEPGHFSKRSCGLDPKELAEAPLDTVLKALPEIAVSRSRQLSLSW